MRYTGEVLEGTKDIGRISVMLDGTDDYITWGTNTLNAALNGAAGITVQFWVNPTALTSTGGQQNCFISIYINDGTAGFGLKAEDGGKIRLVTRSAAADTAVETKTDNIVLSTGVWYHVAAVVDYTNKTNYIYVNGQLMKSASSLTYASNTYTAGTATVPEYFGTYYPVPAGSCYSGYVAETRLFKTPLSQADIIKYSASYNFTITTQVAYWKFNDGSGTSALDSSGNSRTATLTGITGAAVYTHALVDRSRHANNGVFTGLTWSKLPSGLYVMPFLNAAHLCTITQNSSINDLKQMSFSCWVYNTGAGGANSGRIFDKTGSTTKGKLFVISAPAYFTFIQYFSGGLASWTTAAGTIPVGAWSHIQISYDNTSVDNNPVICINGVSKSVTETTTPVGTAVSDAAADLIIGNRSDAARYLNGKIAMPKMWNYLRTEAQALAEYNRTKYLFGL